LTTGGLLAVLAVFVVLGRETSVTWARRTAARHLEAGAIGAAQRSLNWAAWVSQGNYRTDLMRATCARRLGEIDAWRSALEKADRDGAPVASVELERKLGNLRWGQVESVAWSDYDALVEVGAAPRDAVHSVVHGLLAKGTREKAQKLIDAWESNTADEENAADRCEASFLRGVCWWSAGQLDLAQAEFQRVLDLQPRHEMAHAGLARLFEDQLRYSQALEHDRWLVAAAPDRESARVDLARLLRKAGRLDDARALITPPASGSDASEPLALELAELEFESGNYKAAKRWFEHGHLDKQRAPETIRTAAINAALLGDVEQAERLFPQVDDPQGISRRRDELRRRVAIDPADLVATRELEQLPMRSTLLPPPTGGNTSEPTPAGLFSRHCAACHGQEGYGAGRAARYLHPRPRNLRAEAYRLSSTLNHIPTPADIEYVIRMGIPGTSMPSFARLPEDQQRMLAEEVQRLFGERFGDGGTVSVAGDVLPLPTIGPPNAESIARGRAAYFRSGCQHCHGDDGTAATVGMLYDDAGRPTSARNLVHDPLKGGPQGESLYRRIRLGMPGTPHPASPGLGEEDLTALVHFCQSLGREPKQQLTNHERAARAAKRRSSSPIDPAPDQSATSAPVP